MPTNQKGSTYQPETPITGGASSVSDFGSFAGSDQTLTTAATPPKPTDGKASAGKAKVSGTSASVRVSCAGEAGSTCKLTLKLTVTEKFKGKKLISVTARKKKKKKKVTKTLVVVGTARVTLKAGESKTVHIALNGTGKRLLKNRHKLKVTHYASRKLSPTGKRRRSLPKPSLSRQPSDTGRGLIRSVAVRAGPAGMPRGRS